MMHAEFDSNGFNYTTTIVDIEGNFTRHLLQLKIMRKQRTEPVCHQHLLYQLILLKMMAAEVQVPYTVAH